MNSIHAKCIVPAEFRAHSWPDTFTVLPRVGDSIAPAGVSDVTLVVAQVIHRNRERMHQPPDSLAEVELHCEKPKALLLE